MTTLAQQVKRNLLSIISLTVAFIALGYNTWRNEASEENRNYRAAGFEIFREAAHLQLLVDQAYYSDNKESADPIEGWARVNLILSLSSVMEEPVKKKAIELNNVWQDNWSLIYRKEEANKSVTKAIVELDESVRDTLVKLN